ncbi:MULTISPECIES: hypothetical protein [unclassified Brevundimonas]|uniref:hypothetical protein n=1 Tax=unclassified Brevundimonas TaxID=2622653 RepID=UPI0025BF6970|nr:MULTISPECIES: hypothetical protein [unclassified Brevundimonas]
MLLKEKMFLANCDPVRRLSPFELEKRFLMSIALSKGAILTPNLLLDNAGMGRLLDNSLVRRWSMSKEGRGGVVIRVPGASAPESMEDYFDNLPPNHYLARFQCCKQDLTGLDLAHFKSELHTLDRNLRRIKPAYSPVSLHSRSLSDAVMASASLAQWQADRHELEKPLRDLLRRAPDLGSRSMWYQASEELLGEDAVQFKLEVIDACYNGLFVASGEAFVMDRIAVLDRVPISLLSVGVGAVAFGEQRKLFEYALKGFDLVTAFGAGQLVEFLTDEAVSFVENKLQDTSFKWATRRNWFGLYPRLTQSMGVEIR